MSATFVSICGSNLSIRKALAKAFVLNRSAASFAFGVRPDFPFLLIVPIVLMVGGLPLPVVGLAYYAFHYSQVIFCPNLQQLVVFQFADDFHFEGLAVDVLVNVVLNDFAGCFGREVSRIEG